MPPSIFNVGLCAFSVGFGLTIFSLILFAVDTALPADRTRLTHELRQYLFANMLFTWIIIVGSITFHYSEGWDFSQATEYSVVTILTIGYGTLVTKTDRGKLLTIAYATCGLAVVGFLFISFESLMYPRNEQLPTSLPAETSQDYSAGIPLQQFGSISSVVSHVSTAAKPAPWYKSLALYIIVFSWWFISSAIFGALENWKYLDALYFTFISMTGIGFGDITPESPWGIQFWLYFLFTTVIFINVVGDFRIRAKSSSTTLQAEIHERARAHLSETSCPDSEKKEGSPPFS